MFYFILAIGRHMHLFIHSFILIFTHSSNRTHSPGIIIIPCVTQSFVYISIINCLENAVNFNENESKNNQEKIWKKKIQWIKKKKNMKKPLRFSTTFFVATRLYSYSVVPLLQTPTSEWIVRLLCAIIFLRRSVYTL